MVVVLKMNSTSQMDQVQHFANSTGSSVSTRQTQTDFYDSTSLPSVSNLSEHPLQQADWIPVNNLLREWGFEPVVLSHANKLNDASELGFAVLDSFQAASLRTTIEGLLCENKRRQELVNELLQSQSTLQKKSDEEEQKSGSYKTELLSCKSLLENEKIKCQELELLRAKELETHAEQVGQLEESNRDLVKTKRQLAKENQDLKLLIMKHKVTFNEQETTNDDELFVTPRRSSSKSVISPSTSGKSRRKKSFGKTRNEKVLKEYEGKLVQMQQEFESLRLKMSSHSSPNYPTWSPDDERTDTSSSMSVQVPASARQPLLTSSDISKQTFHKALASHSKSSSVETDDTGLVSSSAAEVSDASFLFKRLKMTEKKLKEAKRAIKDYEKENKSLRAELLQRPKAKEFAKLVLKCKEMEKVIEDNNLGFKLTNSPGALEKTIHGCTHVGNVGFLPIDVCRQHIKEIAGHLSVTNLLDIPDRLQEISRMDTLSNKTIKVLRKLDALTRAPDTDDIVDNSSSLTEERESFLDGRAQSVLSTVSGWRKELENLKNVQVAISSLSEVLRPWKQEGLFVVDKRQKSMDRVNTEDIINSLEHLTKDCQRGPIKHRHGKPSETQLLAVMEHLMKLFDIESFSGVFARMNDVYLRFSEMSNVLKTSRELLNLESNCSLSSVVNAVGSLSRAKAILHVDDLDRVIVDVQKYDEFYSAFKTVMDELLDTLGVSEVDEVIPAVKALIRYP